MSLFSFHANENPLSKSEWQPLCPQSREIMRDEKKGQMRHTQKRDQSDTCNTWAFDREMFCTRVHVYTCTRVSLQFISWNKPDRATMRLKSLSAPIFELIMCDIQRDRQIMKRNVLWASQNTLEIVPVDLWHGRGRKMPRNRAEDGWTDGRMDGPTLL